MPAPSRIVDSHQHVFWHGRDDHGLVRDLDAHGIDYAWLLSWEIPPAEDNPGYHATLNPCHFRADGTHAGIPLQDLLLTRDHYPDRFLVGFCPHPLVGNAPARLKAAAGIHGVKICGEWKFRIPFDDPRCLEVYYQAGALGLPVVLHLDVPYLLKDGKRTYQPSWYGGTIDNLARALEACPDTTFLGHAPGFWREISTDAATDPTAYPRGPITGRGRLWDLFDRHPNLWADLSAGSALNALKRDPSNAVEFLCAYSDRLLFGRDYYGTDLHDFLQTLDLPTEVVEKLYHRNAERLVPR
jgi:predicted TIM-barrel fold metal-dependent hydrolase